MDALSLLRMLGALMLVLGGLVCALWAVRRYNLTLPRKWLEQLGSPGAEKRLQVVERLAVDQRRSLVLLRRDDVEFSVMIGPEGVVVLDTAAVARTTIEATPPAMEPPRAEAEESAARKPAEAPAKAEEPLSFAAHIPVLPDIWFSAEPQKAELH